MVLGGQKWNKNSVRRHIHHLTHSYSWRINFTTWAGREVAKKLKAAQEPASASGLSERQREPYSTEHLSFDKDQLLGMGPIPTDHNVESR